MIETAIRRGFRHHGIVLLSIVAGLALLVRALALPIGIVPSLASSRRPSQKYRVIHVYPHDPRAFTQGLVYLDGFLYESTGLNGYSSLRKVDLESGRVLQQRDLPREFFGEGLTTWKDYLIQLTWKSHKGLVYDRSTFRLLETFEYAGEGWGLTHDDKHLILSDGSSSLRFLNPETWRETRRIFVFDHGKAVLQLNELEYMDGEIYANVWQTDSIARISPATGNVLGWIDLRGLLSSRERARANVLNGIAYDPQRHRIFVTGKLWPKLFEIEVLPETSGVARSDL